MNKLNVPYRYNVRQYTVIPQHKNIVLLVAFVLNSDVSDYSAVVLKRFGPKRVLRDCSRYRAMAKRKSTMLMLFKKADRASATDYAEIKKFFH